MHDLAALDDAIITRLKASATVFRQVETLDSEEDLLDSKLPPASAFVLIGRGQFSPPIGHSNYQEGTLDVSVFVVARNVRGKGAARKESAGAYALITAAGDALLGFQPDAGNGALYLVSIASVLVDKVSAIYEIIFRFDISEES